VNAIRDQANALVSERFLLEEDAARFIKEAAAGEVLASPLR
jgi:hypothetical protein